MKVKQFTKRISKIEKNQRKLANSVRNRDITMIDAKLLRTIYIEQLRGLALIQRYTPI